MKIKILFALAASFFAAFAGRAVTPGAISTVTLTLTASFTNQVSNSDPAVFQTAATSAKYSNKELLQDLFDEGALTGATSITGWKLVVVDTTPLISDAGSTLVFYAVNDTTIIRIDPTRFGLDVSSGYSAETGKFVYADATQTGTPVSTSDKFTSTVFLTAS